MSDRLVKKIHVTLLGEREAVEADARRIMDVARKATTYAGDLLDDDPESEFEEVFRG